MARQCLVSTILHQPAAESSAIVKEGLQQSMFLELPMRELAEDAKCEDLEKFPIGDDPEKFFQVGAQLPPREKEELVVFLKNNIDVFAQNAYEAPGVDSSFICPFVTPKKQPPQRSSKENFDAVKKEVNKLKQARAIKEVFYPEWLVNIVVVKRKVKSGEYAWISQIEQGLSKGPLPYASD